MDNNSDISRPSSTKEVFDAIAVDMRRYKSKIDDVKAEAKSNGRVRKLREIQHQQDLQEINFMRDIGNQQKEREDFLADKSKEVEKFRQEVKQKKSRTELMIEKFHDELKR